MNIRGEVLNIFISKSKQLIFLQLHRTCFVLRLSYIFRLKCQITGRGAIGTVLTELI